MSTKPLICSHCRKECSIVEVDVDYCYFPYTQRSLRSDCCQDYITDDSGRIYWQCELKEPYIHQLSL